MRSDRYSDDDALLSDNPATKREYCRPQIVHELRLETRAGSPLGLPDPLDPAGLDPAN